MKRLALTIAFLLMMPVYGITVITSNNNLSQPGVGATILGISTGNNNTAAQEFILQQQQQQLLQAQRTQNLLNQQLLQQQQREHQQKMAKLRSDRIKELQQACSSMNLNDPKNQAYRSLCNQLQNHLQYHLPLDNKTLGIE
ncbi:MAG: hypothetical protein KIT27_11340 [Legionellales bacterium]|nr:hypothetical protein [Legionellales bacterium]